MHRGPAFGWASVHLQAIVCQVERLEDLEVHFYCELYLDRLSVLGGGLELVLADSFYGFFVEAHAYAPGYVDVGRLALLVDDEVYEDVA